MLLPAPRPVRQYVQPATPHFVPQQTIPALRTTALKEAETSPELQPNPQLPVLQPNQPAGPDPQLPVLELAPQQTLEQALLLVSLLDQPTPDLTPVLVPTLSSALAH